ncbi:MAG: GNAT family N-acetyltransferase [Cyanobacteria bacterium P01_D01_bin.56]
MLFRSKLDRLITFLGIAGFVFAISLSQRVFPTAAVDFTVPRHEIRQTAAAYLGNQSQEDISQYRSTQRFSQNWFASIYLQQTLGIEATNQLIQQEQLPIYYWGLRWFKPSQKEESYLALSTTGDILEYRHDFPDDATGANLDSDAAQKIAETYLTNDRGWELSTWELFDTSTTEQEERTDHMFTWKRTDPALEDAELRLAVDVAGDEISYYGYWLKIPEEFSREHRKQGNLASFFDRISTQILVNGTLTVAFVFYAIAIAQGKVRWQSGLLPALIFFTVSLLSRWNGLTLAQSYYSTTENYYLFWLQTGFDSIYYTAINTVPIYFLWSGGQQLAKRLWPLRDMFLPRHPNRLAVFTRAYWRGLMFSGIHMAYVVGFYLIATRIFGSWTPMGVDYSNLFSTPLPFISPLETGIIPAIDEELSARLVGIGIILLLTRSRWLALTLSGGLWALAHLTYVRDPFYLRGIELWLPAIFLGLIFLRYGLLTAMVSHGVYNAFQGIIPLLETQDIYLIGSGIVVIILILLPLTPGLWQRWKYPDRWFAAQKETVLDIVSPVAEDWEQIQALPLKNLALPKIEDWSKTHEILCLKSEQGIEGVSIAALEPDSYGATVQMVYVTPYYRRCYYGTKLLQALAKRLKQRGVTNVRTRIQSSDVTAKRFWANQNWKTSSNTFQTVI